jgi:NADP-dependent aldehyde dehydrogenase
MTVVESVDPRTGRPAETVAAETTPAAVDAMCRRAAAAAPALEAMGRAGRATLLRVLADGLEARRADIVRVADRETALREGRLDGELTRTCFQLRLFAEVLEEGSYVEASIDRPAETGMGPRPDIRRMLMPIGPVAVFGASNFPLAFSVPGGDTASALAAGCPVVVKAHASHPATSQLCFDVLVAAAATAGAPEGILHLVHGLQAGAELVRHPDVHAVGFTGSLAGAQALVRIIEGRPDPIPFFGELSSLNPVVVTPAAAAERAEELARGLVGSFTMGAGQFCTKPGLVFVPNGSDGDRLVRTMAAAVADTGPQWMLNQRIVESYVEKTAGLLEDPALQCIATGSAPRGAGFETVPALLAVQDGPLPVAATEEVFGPMAVVARYRDPADLLAALHGLPASLTTTVLTGEAEVELPATVTAALRHRTGRFVFNGYPTGVTVSWAQHHGGSWPATNSQHTSVGTTAIRRFLHPVAFQSAHEQLLPAELRDEGPAIPRRIDGVLVLPPAASS